MKKPVSVKKKDLFSIFELKGKGHEPSRAENHSARAMAQASFARTHHQITTCHPLRIFRSSYGPASPFLFLSYARVATSMLGLGKLVTHRLRT